MKYTLACRILHDSLGINRLWLSADIGLSIAREKTQRALEVGVVGFGLLRDCVTAIRPFTGDGRVIGCLMFKSLLAPPPSTLQKNLCSFLPVWQT